MYFFDVIGKCDLAVCVAVLSLAGAFALAIFDMFRTPGKKTRR